MCVGVVSLEASILPLQMLEQTSAQPVEGNFWLLPNIWETSRCKECCGTPSSSLQGKVEMVRENHTPPGFLE